MVCTVYSNHQVIDLVVDSLLQSINFRFDSLRTREFFFFLLSLCLEKQIHPPGLRKQSVDSNMDAVLISVPQASFIRGKYSTCFSLAVCFPNHRVL